MAKLNDKIVGVVTGYKIPNQKNQLFVWQVAVDSSQRGRSLGKNMIKWLINTSKSLSIQTTISPSNKASQAMFQSLARDLHWNLEKAPYLNGDDLLGHEAEELYTLYNNQIEP